MYLLMRTSQKYFKTAIGFDKCFQHSNNFLKLPDVYRIILDMPKIAMYYWKSKSDTNIGLFCTKSENLPKIVKTTRSLIRSYTLFEMPEASK